ncbi:MAG: hypothetical protein H8D32_04250 [Dehalococcoidia bacterium]|nr:hypothetical protein [Dehalococcoidia bacterium]
MMLVITAKAKEKLREIAEKEAPETGPHDAATALRLRLSGLDNGSHSIECRFGIDQAQAGDEVEDIGGAKLVIDPSSFGYLRRISAILDLSQVGPGEQLILIIEGS